MSYNRSTQAPCSATCCVPSAFTATSQPWLQDGVSSVYNIDAGKGIYSNSVTASASSMVFSMPIEYDSPPPVTTYCDSADMGMTVSGTVGTDSDSSVNQYPVYAKTCQWDADCATCSGAIDFTCTADGAEEWATECFTDGQFGYGECWDDPSGLTSVAVLALGYQGYLFSSGGGIADVDWYATGIKIKGTPNTFVGYPSELDACNAIRKGMRKMWAKYSLGVIYIRWLVAKEWDTGGTDVVYSDSMQTNTNQFGDLATAIQANVDVGLQAVGSTSDKTLYRNIRLGDGSGDGSFGDDSGWYDITNNAVEFQYQKPSQTRRKCEVRIDYGGDSCEHCCDDSCTCLYAGWEWVSDYVRITTSTQVEDGSGNQIWDAGDGGANFGGTWTLVNNTGQCEAGATLTVS